MPLRDVWTGAATYTHLGLTLALSVIGMFFLGWWIDGKLGSRPLLAIIGAFIGAAGGFINLIKTLNRLQEDEERRSHQGKDE